jgi:hypothetical protein
MNKERINFIDVSIKNLQYPINIGLKKKAEGEQIIANINVQAKIEKKMEGRFESGVIEIISERNKYKGPKQLSSKLIDYLDKLKAASTIINFRYPFFYDRTIKGTNINTLIKYMCEYTIIKNTLKEFKQKYKVKLSIIADKYLIPGLKKEILDIPAKIVVEIEGFDTIFTEDIIEIVERGINKNEYNTLRESIKNILNPPNAELELIESIESELYKNNDIDSCSVKMINKKLPYDYSVEVSSEERSLEFEKKYAGSYLFI